MDGEDCLAGGPPCRYTLEGGGVYRVAGTHAIRVPAMLARRHAGVFDVSLVGHRLVWTESGAGRASAVALALP